MPPLPAAGSQPQPTSTDLLTFTSIINYISTSIARGTLSRIPAFHPPPRGRLSAAGHGAEVQAAVRRRREPANGEMMRVLEGVKGHMVELEDDPSLGITLYELRALLPDLTSATASLLASPPFNPFGPLDADVLALAQWFKSTYMRWIDPIPCPACSGPTFAAGSADPTPQERADGGGRVELHVCKDGKCAAQRRFVRYGLVRTLVKTREGRCGEWAHLFYVFLRAKGIEARYIWNSEDHVWCEYWSPTLKHWVHVDPCEAATNKPLIYALGWGKRQAFCLAFGKYGAEDVTRAYVDDYEGECQERRRARGWKERDLRRELLALTIRLRLRLPPSERVRLEALDQLQAQWIADEHGRRRETEKMGVLGVGRVSGPEDWKRMRDELGLGKGEGGKGVEKVGYRVLETLKTDPSTLHLLGDAHLSNKTILLTTSTSQTSAAFHHTPLSQSESFACKLKFRLVAPPGAGEADGIAVAFSGERRLGVGGYGLGYTGLGGEGDFAVEVDTYRTQDYASDPPTPHISIHSPPHAHHRHSIGCTAPGSIPHLSDGRVYGLEVVFKAVGRRVRGFLQVPDEGEGKDAGEETLELFDVVIPEGKGGEWFVGVAGSCGGLWQKQEVMEWEISKIAFEDEEAEGRLTGEEALADPKKETDDL